MSDKITLQTIGSLQNQTEALTKINANFDDIAEKIDTLLSRDGDTPNQMETNLDMNSYRVTNLPEPLNVTEPARLQEIQDIVSGGIPVGSIDGDRITTATLPVDRIEGTVPNSKLADMTQATIKGRADATGTGAPTDLTASQVRTITGVPVGASTSDVGKEYSVRNGPTILIPPARYKMADHLAGGVPSGSAATDTTAFDAVVARMIADGGNRILELPAGTVKLTSGIEFSEANVNGVAIVGAGRGRTILQAQSLTGNDIVIGNPSLALKDYTLEKFSILPAGTKTAGAAVLVNDAQKVNIDIEILGGFRGIQYENAGDLAVCYIENPYITGLVEDGFVFGLANNFFVNGLWVNGGIVAQCRRAATFHRASGLHFHGTESYQASGDAWCFEPIGIGIQGIWMKGILGDSAGGRGWSFMSTYGSAAMAEIYMTACQAGSCAARGLEVDSGVNLNGLYITDPLIVNTGASGMRFAATTAKNVHIQGGQVSHSNGIGIAFENGVEEWSVCGVKSGHLGWFAANSISARQTHGLYVGTSNNHYRIDGNTWVRNTTTGLDNNSSGAANKQINANMTV